MNSGPATQAFSPNADRLVIRWTIGNVRERGFEMLRLSIACAFRVFGPLACYLVGVNTVSVSEAQQRTGALPIHPEWRQVTPADVPPDLRSQVDGSLMQGMAWKLAPLRTYPERYELALDNDCILWDLPDGMRRWLQSPDAYLFAEDVDRCLGSFDSLCPPGAFNAGIRGLPPGQDLRESLAHVLAQRAAMLSSNHQPIVAEIEEQGLQAAAMLRLKPLFLVKTSEVSLCSPFWPRSPELGPCGAHFVGMNAPHIPFNYYDRPADDWLAEHWRRHRPALYARAGLSLSEIREAA
jgi:hypothetical protein